MGDALVQKKAPIGATKHIRVFVHKPQRSEVPIPTGKDTCAFFCFRIVRGLLGTAPPDPTLESASLSPPQGSIWHRFNIESTSKRHRFPDLTLPVVQMALQTEKKYFRNNMHFIADTDTDENSFAIKICRSRYRRSCSLQF